MIRSIALVGKDEKVSKTEIIAIGNIKCISDSLKIFKRSSKAAIYNFYSIKQRNTSKKNVIDYKLFMNILII